MATSVVLWLALAVLLAAVTGAGLYLLLGRPRLPDVAAFTTAELLDLLKIGLAVVGGLGAVVALAVAYRRQQVSEAEHLITRRQDAREETKYLNERYGQAAEQLGHESFAVRLAGVHAMVGVADDWADKRQTCVDVLCGYLRTPYPDGDRTEREVRQAITAALIDRAAEWRVVEIDFRNAEFTDLDLTDRIIRGRLLFDRAVFKGRTTSFNGVRFLGRASFRGAVFGAETTDFRYVSAAGTNLDFTGAVLTGRWFDFSTVLLERTPVGIDLVKGDGCVIRVDGRELAGVAELAAALKPDTGSGTPGAGRSPGVPPPQ